MTAAVPSGGVTFLFTHVEGLTRRWEADAEGMRAALAAHDEVLRKAIEAHGGWLFKHTGHLAHARSLWVVATPSARAVHPAAHPPRRLTAAARPASEPHGEAPPSIAAR